MFLRIFQHLLPRAKAWSLTVTKPLRAFFQSLADSADDVRDASDLGYLDYFSAYTRLLDDYEAQFGLPVSNLSEADRRTRLAGARKLLGGQNPLYIQETLQNNGFDVYVHEWWVPGVLHPAGGSVDGDEPPVARNPFDYIWDGVSAREYVGMGHDSAFMGGDSMFMNSQLDPPGYFLVNKVLESSVNTVGMGHFQMYMGGDYATAAGRTTLDYSYKNYQFPADPTKYPFVLYIGGETFPTLATIPSSRREEFEELCLRICPLELWLGILVQYT